MPKVLVSLLKEVLCEAYESGGCAAAEGRFRDACLATFGEEAKEYCANMLPWGMLGVSCETHISAADLWPADESKDRPPLQYFVGGPASVAQGRRVPRSAQLEPTAGAHSRMSSATAGAHSRMSSATARANDFYIPGYTGLVPQRHPGAHGRK